MEYLIIRPCLLKRYLSLKVSLFTRELFMWVRRRTYGSLPTPMAIMFPMIGRFGLTVDQSKVVAMICTGPTLARTDISTGAREPLHRRAMCLVMGGHLSRALLISIAPGLMAVSSKWSSPGE